MQTHDTLLALDNDAKELLVFIEGKIGTPVSVVEEDTGFLEHFSVSLDLSAVSLETLMAPGNPYVSAELGDGMPSYKFFHLDARVWKALLEDPLSIPEEWKGIESDNPPFIIFSGSKLAIPDARERFLLFLRWSDEQQAWKYGIQNIYLKLSGLPLNAKFAVIPR